MHVGGLGMWVQYTDTHYSCHLWTASATALIALLLGGV